MPHSRLEQHQQRRRRRGGGDDGAATSDHGGGAQPQPQPQPPVAPELLDFLATAPGAQWLAEQLLAFPRGLDNLKRQRMSDVNAWVLDRYRAFTSSDIGQRMLRAPPHARAAREDTLALPVFLIEDLVRTRLRERLTHHWFRVGFFLATVTPVCCGAVWCAKALVKRHLLQRAERRGRRWQRLCRAVEFVLDELVPTGTYGALAAAGLLSLRLVRDLDEA